MPAPKALAACPLAAMGAPSKQVATELGVPGILIRMAEIRPPEIAPMYRLISRHMVLVLSMVKTMDMNTEMASVALMPGIAPKTIPTAVPRTISRRQPGVMTAWNAALKYSISPPPYLKMPMGILALNMYVKGK